MYLCWLAHLINLGKADMVTSLMFIKNYLTNPVGIWNLIDGIKGVFLSFELIIVNIINALNNKYNDRPSWNNLETHNSRFISFSYPESKFCTFLYTEMRDMVKYFL